jgi:hypothetical protein
VSIERIGTDGDEDKARRLYRDLDGKVDAFGVGGIDLYLRVKDRVYKIYQAFNLIQDVRQTPIVDGGGLKMTLERQVMQFVEREIGDEISPKTALVTAGVDRFGSVLSLEEAGYEAVYADLMFGLGLPIAIRSIRMLEIMAATLLPVLGRLPISVIYPTGEKQSTTIPKFGSYYQWASVIAGDFLYVRRHMPDRLDGKVIVTNTTTLDDIEFVRQRGVKALVTTTPRIEGRSFGTNVMEATLVALAGKGRPLEHHELQEMLAQLGFQPTLERLN